MSESIGDTTFGDIDIGCYECGERVFAPANKVCPHCGVPLKWSAIENRWVPRD